MTISYLYTTKTEWITGIHGPFQCDVEDFRCFFKNRPRYTKWIRVTLQDEDGKLLVHWWTSNSSWSDPYVTKFTNEDIRHYLIDGLHGLDR